jgi:hypothetical protein
MRQRLVAARQISIKRKEVLMVPLLAGAGAFPSGV